MTSQRPPSAVTQLGRLLAGYRVRGGLTQEETAELAELSVRGLRNLERGLVATPRRRTVDALVSALALGPDDAGHLRRQVRAARAESAHEPDTDPVGWYAHIRTGQANSSTCSASPPPGGSCS